MVNNCAVLNLSVVFSFIQLAAPLSIAYLTINYEVQNISCRNIIHQNIDIFTIDQNINTELMNVWGNVLSYYHCINWWFNILQAFIKSLSLLLMDDFSIHINITRIHLVYYTDNLPSLILNSFIMFAGLVVYLDICMFTLIINVNFLQFLDIIVWLLLCILDTEYHAATAWCMLTIFCEVSVCSIFAKLLGLYHKCMPPSMSICPFSIHST